MSDCKMIRPELLAYHRAGTDAGATASIRLHLQSCGGCQDELAQMQRLESLLDRHLGAIKPSPGLASSFANRLAAEIAAEEQRSQQPGWFAWLHRPLLLPLAVAAAAATLAITIMPREAGDESSPVAVRQTKPEEARVAESAPAVEPKPAAVAAKPAAHRWPAIAFTEDPEVYVDFDVIQNLDRIAPELVSGTTG